MTPPDSATLRTRTRRVKRIWPTVTGRAFPSLKPLTLQLWLWFVGMMVMTLPWHYTGLQGQWRRVAAFASMKGISESGFLFCSASKKSTPWI